MRLFQHVLSGICLASTAAAAHAQVAGHNHPSRDDVAAQVFTSNGAAPLVVRAPAGIPAADASPRAFARQVEPARASIGQFRGCYGGLHGGGLARTATVGVPASLNSLLPEQRVSITGTFLGLHAGCNYQTGNFVMGVELDGSLPFSAKGKSDASVIGYDLESNTYSAKEGIFGGVSLRGGFVVGKTLFFGKFGLTKTSLDLTNKRETARVNVYNGSQYLDGTPSDGTQPVQHFSSMTSKGRLTGPGYVFGFGAEYEVDDRWTISGEYNLVYHAATTLTLNQSGTGTSFSYASSNGARTETTTSGGVTKRPLDVFGSLVKLGVNRRF